MERKSRHAASEPEAQPAVKVLAGSSLRGERDGRLSAIRFRYISAICQDPKGNLLICDQDNHTIRLFKPSTTEVWTIAGQGSREGLGPRRDRAFRDGPLEESLFAFPTGIACDKASGIIYVADRRARRVRAVNRATKLVSTLAGSGKGNRDGSLEQATFHAPMSLVLLHDKLYISDYEAHCIRCIDFTQETVSTVAGVAGFSGYRDSPTGRDALFDSPAGLTLDHRGDLVFCDSRNHRVRRVALSSGDDKNAVTTVAGNGADRQRDGRALKASLSNPWHIVADPSGDLFIYPNRRFHFSDRSQGAVRTMDWMGGAVALYRSPDGVVYGCDQRGAQLVEITGLSNSGGKDPAAAEGAAESVKDEEEEKEEGDKEEQEEQQQQQEHEEAEEAAGRSESKRSVRRRRSSGRHRRSTARAASAAASGGDEAATPAGPPSPPSPPEQKDNGSSSSGRRSSSSSTATAGSFSSSSSSGGSDSGEAEGGQGHSHSGMRSGETGKRRRGRPRKRPAEESEADPAGTTRKKRRTAEKEGFGDALSAAEAMFSPLALPAPSSPSAAAAPAVGSPRPIRSPNSTNKSSGGGGEALLQWQDQKTVQVPPALSPGAGGGQLSPHQDPIVPVSAARDPAAAAGGSPRAPPGLLALPAPRLSPNSSNNNSSNLPSMEQFLRAALQASDPAQAAQVAAVFQRHYIRVDQLADFGYSQLTAPPLNIPAGPAMDLCKAIKLLAGQRSAMAT